MKELCVLLLVSILCLTCCHCYLYPRINAKPVKGTYYGDPVFLTELIEKGEIQKARSESEVPTFKANVSSFAGFFTVNKKYNSNMFFWFFPSEDGLKAPVIVWLQGGPGASSLFGLFNENGPFYVKKQRGLKSRRYYWPQTMNVIYIDNPVGTGFSFTDNELGYAKDETDVGANLYSALTQFFQVFPEYTGNDFFVTGESYAGKYVPALAYAIHTKNPTAKVKINLKGMAIGNGLCDPETMMDYGNYLYQLGLLDVEEKTDFETKQNEIVKFIQQKKFIPAFDAFDELLNGDLTPYKSLFYNSTGFNFYFNFLHDEDYSPYGDFGDYIDKIRKAIHVGNLTFHSGQEVEKHLKNDVMQSIKPWFEVLVEKYRVLIYNGQLDIIVPYPLTTNFLRSVNWSGANAFKVANRMQWKVDGKLAGYTKTVKGLTQVLVRDAGHMVPMDQPLWALDLMTRFTHNKPFN